MTKSLPQAINVVITSVGSNTAISVIKALRHTFSNVTIVGVDINERHLCAGASLVDFFYTVPGCTYKEAYMKALTSIILQHSIHCLLPIHDLEIELLAQENDQLSINTFVAVNRWSIVEICNNKIKATDAAQAVGLKVPIIYTQPIQFKFPMIRKPVRGVSSSGITIIPDQQSYVSTDANKDFFYQEFIRGIEYTVDAYSTQDGIFYGGIVRQRIETKAGISTKGVTKRNDSLLEGSRKLLDHLKYRGASNLQFIERDGDYYFIEINPRFSGAGILSYEAGFNSPEYMLLEALGLPLPEFSHQKLKYDLYMSRYWQESFTFKQ